MKILLQNISVVSTKYKTDISLENKKTHIRTVAARIKFATLLVRSRRIRLITAAFQKPSELVLRNLERGRNAENIEG